MWICLNLISKIVDICGSFPFSIIYYSMALTSVLYTQRFGKTNQGKTKRGKIQNNQVQPLKAFMIQDLYERSKRDSSISGSDSSSSSSGSGSDSSSSDSDSSSSSGGDGDNTTPVDECALLSNYITTDLAAFPDDINMLYNFTVANRVAPVFLDLLTSAPTLFADLSLAIDTAANLTPDSAILAALVELPPTFLALARDTCGLSLSQQLIQNVDGLFFPVLPAFFLQ